MQKFVNTTLGLLPTIDKLISEFADKKAEDTSQDDLYNLACSLIEIKEYYHAVTLLHVAMTFQKEGSAIDS